MTELEKDPDGVAPLDLSVEMPDMVSQLICDMCMNDYTKRPSATEVRRRLGPGAL